MDGRFYFPWLPWVHFTFNKEHLQECWEFFSTGYVYKNLCQKSSAGTNTAKYDSCPPSPLSVNTSAGLVPGTIGLLSPPLSVAVHSMPDASPTFRSSSLRRDSELTVWAGGSGNSVFYIFFMFSNLHSRIFCFLLPFLQELAWDVDFILSIIFVAE